MDADLWTRQRAAEDRTARAALAGAAHALLFAVLGGLALAARTLHDRSDYVPFGYAAALAALAAGTARRNRAAAVLLLALAFWVEGGVWLARRSVPALVMVLVFCRFYVGGVRGAFSWHRLERERRATAMLARSE